MNEERLREIEAQLAAAPAYRISASMCRNLAELIAALRAAWAENEALRRDREVARALAADLSTPEAAWEEVRRLREALQDLWGRDALISVRFPE